MSRFSDMQTKLFRDLLVSATAESTISSDAIEGFTIIGTSNPDVINGSVGNDFIFGFGGNDTITGGVGDDDIDGGVGLDIMEGGLGNDKFYIDDAFDIVRDSVNGGQDIALTTVSYALQENSQVDILNVRDKNSTFAINLTGSNSNAMFGLEGLNGNDGDNILKGLGGTDGLFAFGGNDTLDGGAGDDVMDGGTGDDVYLVDNLGEEALEAVNCGLDKVLTTVNYSLVDTLEIEILEVLDPNSTFSINLTGAKRNETLIGNNGANILDGKGGIDTLTGKGGKDTFSFHLSDPGHDKVKDFKAVDDKIDLFIADSGAGAFLTSEQFFSGQFAHDADDRVIYDQRTGNLYYDKDGRGGETQKLFAVLLNKPVDISSADIFAVGL